MIEIYIKWLTFQQKFKSLSLKGKATQAFYSGFQLRLFEGYCFDLKLLQLLTTLSDKKIILTFFEAKIYIF